MKLEPLFTVKDNKLYKLEDNSAVEISSLKKIEIKWSDIELEPETYNEEYLAKLRDDLKIMDDSGSFAILIPVVDKNLKTPEDFELFTNAYNHAARRIKDCISVTGYELPSELTSAGFAPNTPAAAFMETLAIKHAQYVYFTNCKEAPSNVVIL